MLSYAARRQLLFVPCRCRSISTTPQTVPVPLLKDPSIEYFRREYFVQEKPVLFPRGHFTALPAISKWFHSIRDTPKPSAAINVSYLKQYGDTFVPMELTETHGSSNGSHIEFTRLTAPLLMFLHGSAAKSLGLNAQASNSRLYIAQCPLSDLPSELQEDLPTPEVVKEAGRGDVYDSSIWLGRAPTYTPLHKDPNPNLFVQLAGRKAARLINPEDGETLYREVRRKTGENRGSASFRGDEMMAGQERKVLEEAVWGSAGQNSQGEKLIDAELGPGDGIFIPKGWWHSIKSVDEGMIGSVNWWFR
ncbi:JmjC domain protein [Rhizodiscina lignyota]|uniref:JmjC domain protein n=1 Tax=Rhizodiscina lignyota TaxID=1504668 RepID=A0A9P4IAP9_9PEZI|nr:JmjC domain protein [Rhizodiscina lignyota]